MENVASVQIGSKTDLTKEDHKRIPFDLFEKTMKKQGQNPDNYTLTMK